MSELRHDPRIAYRSGYKYVLMEEARFDLSDYDIRSPLGHEVGSDYCTIDGRGQLVLRRGYAWDGSTGARDTRSSQRGSAVHDALYQLIGIGALPVGMREAADEAYRDMVYEDGVILTENLSPPLRWWRRATAWARPKWRHWALLRFAPREGSKPKPIIYAPTKPEGGVP